MKYKFVCSPRLRPGHDAKYTREFNKNYCRKADAALKMLNVLNDINNTFRCETNVDNDFIIKVSVYEVGTDLYLGNIYLYIMKTK